MGRPRKDPEEARAVTVTTRVKPATRDKIDRYAAHAGLNRSDWVRLAIIDRFTTEGHIP
jgi:uncharacterized protein (DUF1778 family)